MELKKQILMAIIKNSSSHLENDQEIITINEQQLKVVIKEIENIKNI